MRIIFMGTPGFAVNILEKLVSEGHDVRLVVCQPDRKSGRGHKLKFPPVKEAAVRHGIEVLQPGAIKNNENFISRLRSEDPDFIIVAAYGKILPESILELPRYGCVNVHASLLPKLRGASPVAMSIVRGEEITGVSIMKMEAGLDTGDVYAASKTEIGRKHTPELMEELSLMGAELLCETLPGIADGTVTGRPQDDEEATYTGMIAKADGLIDFTKSPVEIDRMVRGYDPWPGAYTKLCGETFKIWDAEPISAQCGYAPGTVVNASESGIDIAAGGGIISAKIVQLPGKRRMSAADFLKGHKIEKHTVLG